MVHVTKNRLYKVAFKISHKRFYKIKPFLLFDFTLPPPSIIIQIYLTYLKNTLKECNLSHLWAKLIVKKISCTHWEV